MKLIAVDERDDVGWRKNWTDLGVAAPQIVEVSKAMTTIADDIGPALVLLHTAVDDASVRKISIMVAQSRDKYVMLVGQSGGAPPRDFNVSSFRLHISKVSFPNGVDLTHLKERFECLVSDLTVAINEVDIKEAFRRFDDDTLREFVELASVLALLPESELLAARLLDRLNDANWCKAVAARVVKFGGLRAALGVPEEGTGTVRPDDVLAFVKNPMNLVALARCL